MNWIELEYTFQDIASKSDNTKTYFEDMDETTNYITEYGFQTIPQMKELLKNRMQGIFSEQEIHNIAVTTFRNKPEHKFADEDSSKKQIVDFIYQF